MTTTREEFEAWMTSETNVREDAVWHQDKQRYTLLSRKQADWVLWQAAQHLAGQRAMQERAAKLCDGLHYRWRFGDDDTDSGPSECAAGVRALEVKP